MFMIGVPVAALANQGAATVSTQVRKGYLDLARRFPERFRKVDAMRLAEPIAADVWKLVSDAFLAQG